MYLWKKYPDYIILHVGTNELNSEILPKRIAKSIIDVAKNALSDNRIVNISDTVPHNGNSNTQAI